MPKKVDLICTNVETRHIEYDVRFGSMDDEFTPCSHVDNGIRCGATRLQYFGSRKIPVTAGLGFHEEHEGVGGRVEFNSMSEMEAHLQRVRDRQHDQDLDYVVLTPQQRAQRREYHHESYWARQRERGWTEADIRRQKEDRLERFAQRS